MEKKKAQEGRKQRSKQSTKTYKTSQTPLCPHSSYLALDTSNPNLNGPAMFFPLTYP